MQKKFAKRLQAIKDKGCAILVILLVTLPLWVLSVAVRGPGFAIGALAVLLLIVLGFAWLSKVTGED